MYVSTVCRRRSQRKERFDGWDVGEEGWPITSDVINVGKRKRGCRWMNGAGIGKKNPLT